MIAPDVPAADEITIPWWDATREHRLLIQVCGSCQHAQHPPRAVCIHCGDTDRLGWQDARGTATVDSFTVVHRAPRPDLEVPYVVARLRLAEGVIALSRLEGRDGDQWRIGDSVCVDWVDLPDGRALPVYRPNES